MSSLILPITFRILLECDVPRQGQPPRRCCATNSNGSSLMPACESGYTMVRARFLPIFRATILIGIVAPFTIPLAPGASREDTSHAHSAMPQTKCTFSDGSTIALGRMASDRPDFDANFWRTGDYVATSFVVSEQMIIPPLDGGLEVPPGTYTLFVNPNHAPPWTLIVSKKTLWGMPYPGEQYDLGRTQMGSDLAPSVDNFTIGCAQYPSAPIVLWMQSGARVAYTKIMAEKTTEGKTEYLWH
jgi:Protein of unknown function (DUF2911)